MAASSREFHAHSDEDLLVLCLQGDRGAFSACVERFDRFLHGVVRSRAYQLVLRNLHDDVVQRTWELVARKDQKSFDPKRGTAKTYLALLVRRAIRDIYASITPPGQVTRPRPNETRTEAGPLSKAESRGGGADTRLVDARDLIEDVEDRVQVEAALAIAAEILPPESVESLRLMATEDRLIGEAASISRKHRTSLRRDFQRLAAYEPFQSYFGLN